MPDTMIVAEGLLFELRDKIKDTAWSFTQFSLRVTGSGVTDIVLEIEENGFSVDVTGGSTPSVDLPLTSSSYDTLEKLVTYLNSRDGYNAQWAESADPEHPSTDLMIQAPTSILNSSYQFKTRRWSDRELTAFLTDALRRHNLSVPRLVQLNYAGNYTLETVPEQHKYFVVLLGQIEVLKTQIQEANKRRGTDLTVTDFVSLKGALEEEYKSSLDNLIKSVESIPPAVLTETDQGDVVIGHSYRTRLYPRYPYRGPITPDVLAPMPKPVTLTALPEGDGVVLLEWQRNRDTNFDRYEIWRGTTDEVTNKSREVQPFNYLDFDGVLIHTQRLQYRTSFVDGVGTALTPGTYYYRIYVYNRNGDFIGSQAVATAVT